MEVKMEVKRSALDNTISFAPFNFLFNSPFNFPFNSPFYSPKSL